MKTDTTCVSSKEEKKRKKKDYDVLWYEKNKEKVKEATRTWRKNNKDRARKAARLAHVRRVYNLSAESYAKLLADQNDACAICSGKLGKHPYVDHNHVTGKVRGLLCIRCNSALGMMDDSPERLRAAAAYIERTQ